MSSVLNSCQRKCSRFWFRPASAVNLAVARILFAGTALWIVLSRPDLPSILTLPDVMWRTVPKMHRIAYLLVFNLTTERVLFVTLAISLAAAVIGWRARLACFVSGLLLYHFAPLETLFWTPDPTLRGLTLPTLGLIILAVSPCNRALSPTAARKKTPMVSPEHRWPLRMLQVLLAELYWFAGLAKLRNAGLAWVSAKNLQDYLMAYSQIFGIQGSPPLGYRVAAHPAVCSFIACIGITVELLFPFALFSKRAAAILVPMAFVIHVGIALLMHIVFLDAALLLIFVDWSVVYQRRLFDNADVIGLRREDLTS